MREIKTAPATIVDLAEMASACSYSRAQWGVARDLMAQGHAWAARVDGELVAMAGIIPIGPEQGQAWFHFQPLAPALMLPIIRAVRLTISAAPYRAIVTICVSEAGKRVARACGFAFAQSSEFGEVWAYGKPVGGWRSGQTRDAITAAHDACCDGSATGRD